MHAMILHSDFILHPIFEIKFGNEGQLGCKAKNPRIMQCSSVHVPAPPRHLHHCRELETAAERAVAEQQACHAQLESLQKTLADQQALLANKVDGAK